MNRVTWATILWLLLAIPAQAGVLLVSQETHPGTPGEKKFTSRAYLEPNRIRVERQGEGTEHVFIYQGDQRIFWMVDKGKKSYMEATYAELKSARDKLMMFEDQIRKLPADKQLLFSNMLKDKIPFPVGAFTPPKVDYKKSKATKVGNWACEVYVGQLEAKKREEVCAAKKEDLGLRQSDFATIQELMGLLSTYLREQIRPYIAGAGDQSSYPGFPVQIMTYDGETVQRKMQLQGVTRENFSNELFTVPKGFKKNKIPSFLTSLKNDPLLNPDGKGKAFAGRK